MLAEERECEAGAGGAHNGLYHFVVAVHVHPIHPANPVAHADLTTLARGALLANLRDHCALCVALDHNAQPRAPHLQHHVERVPITKTMLGVRRRRKKQTVSVRFVHALPKHLCISEAVQKLRSPRLFVHALPEHLCISEAVQKLRSTRVGDADILGGALVIRRLRVGLRHVPGTTGHIVRDAPPVFVHHFPRRHGLSNLFCHSHRALQVGDAPHATLGTAHVVPLADPPAAFCPPKHHQRIRLVHVSDPLFL